MEMSRGQENKSPVERAAALQPAACTGPQSRYAREHWSQKLQKVPLQAPSADGSQSVTVHTSPFGKSSDLGNYNGASVGQDGVEKQV